MKYSLPQEIEVWYVIPAIRNELAKALIILGLKQREVADKLGIRESTVSQYISSKRGNDIEFEKSVKDRIKLSAKNILDNKSCVVKEIQDLCRFIKKNKTLCRIHKQISNIKNCCGACVGDC